MRPKFAQIGRAHGLSKIHKQYFKVLFFQTIMDKTNTTHFGVSKFLTNFSNNTK